MVMSGRWCSWASRSPTAWSSLSAGAGFASGAVVLAVLSPGTAAGVRLQASASRSRLTGGSVVGGSSRVLVDQASARESAGGFCSCTGTDRLAVGAVFLPVVAHWRASASVKKRIWVSRADPPLTTWARPGCLVDFGAGWTSGASMRQALTL
ncbi:hypothetical protein EES37_38205 [Streptomyces sp. ADI91-18]|nr:hypothetical protein EES37_38205 [Streptomyces sp. ADI91-18]